MTVVASGVHTFSQYYAKVFAKGMTGLLTESDRECAVVAFYCVLEVNSAIPKDGETHVTGSRTRTRVAKQATLAFLEPWRILRSTEECGAPAANSALAVPPPPVREGSLIDHDEVTTLEKAEEALYQARLVGSNMTKRQLLQRD